VQGSQALLEAAQESAGLAAGATREDGTLSLLTERCLGVCALAPLVEFDEEVCGKTNAAEVTQHIRSWQRRGTPDRRLG
jgi:NADH:ubiquinone oxidoreductase subunit E